MLSTRNGGNFENRKAEPGLRLINMEDVVVEQVE